MTASKKYIPVPLSVVVTLSSVTMLWLLWRFPIPTGIGSIVLLGGLLHYVRFARSIELAIDPE
jgi:hypothetical protein